MGGTFAVTAERVPAFGAAYLVGRELGGLDPGAAVGPRAVEALGPWDCILGGFGFVDVFFGAGKGAGYHCCGDLGEAAFWREEGFVVDGRAGTVSKQDCNGVREESGCTLLACGGMARSICVGMGVL
jgi:hypothetical protein